MSGRPESAGLRTSSLTRLVARASRPAVRAQEDFPGFQVVGGAGAPQSPPPAGPVEREAPVVRAGPPTDAEAPFTLPAAPHGPAPWKARESRRPAPRSDTPRPRARNEREPGLSLSAAPASPAPADPPAPPEAAALAEPPAVGPPVQGPRDPGAPEPSPREPSPPVLDPRALGRAEQVPEAAPQVRPRGRLERTGEALGPPAPDRAEPRPDPAGWQSLAEPEPDEQPAAEPAPPPTGQLRESAEAGRRGGAGPPETLGRAPSGPAPHQRPHGDGAPPAPDASVVPQVLIDRIEVVTPPARPAAADPLASLAARRVGASRHGGEGRWPA
jgi:hypothetical protein